MLLRDTSMTYASAGSVSPAAAARCAIIDSSSASANTGSPELEFVGMFPRKRKFVVPDGDTAWSTRCTRL